MRNSQSGAVKLSVTFVALAIIVSTAVWSGCGDDGDTTTSSANNSQGSDNSQQAPGKQQAEAEPDQPTTDEVPTDLPEPATKSPKQLSREFQTVRGELTAGRREASDEERAAASESVETFMTGRASDDFDAICDNLSAEMLRYVEGLVETAPDPPDNCPDSLALAVGEYSFVYEATNTMAGPIEGLLVKGNSGYAVYHGKRGVDYLVNMVWEDGGWKVNTLEVMGL